MTPIKGGARKRCVKLLETSLPSPHPLAPKRTCLFGGPVNNAPPVIFDPLLPV